MDEHVNRISGHLATRVLPVALEELHTLVAELERSHPGAAASLREGMAETLTVTRLGIKGSLKRTLQSTNPPSR
jgi:hypothetical protein